MSVVGTHSQWRNTGDLYIGGRMSQCYTMSSDGWKNEWVDIDWRHSEAASAYAFSGRVVVEF